MTTLPPVPVNANAPLAAPIVQTINVVLTIEEIEIPEFFGEETKDTIDARDFMHVIDSMARIHKWSEKVAYSHFALALQGSALEWLHCMVRIYDFQPDKLTWATFKPLFKAESTNLTYDRFINDGLANLSMKPSENVRNYFSRLREMRTVIRDNYDSYANKPARPPPDINAGYSGALLTTIINDAIEDFSDYMLLFLFRAGLPQDIKTFLRQQYNDRLTLNEAYDLANIHHRIASAEKIERLQLEHEEDVAVFQQPSGSFRQQRPNNYRPNGQQNYNGNRNRSYNPGNNSRQNNQICVYCKIMGHRQQECRRRIRDNKPCIDANGRNFWPKSQHRGLAHRQNYI